MLREPKLKAYFHGAMFRGFDFDGTMLRIGSTANQIEFTNMIVNT